MRAQDFASIFDAHENLWEARRPELRRLHNAYIMRFWQRDPLTRGNLLIETSRAYELIESFIASLFVRDPSVVLASDIRGAGDAELSEQIVNVWLKRVRTQIEDGLRLSLIYPNAFLKLSPINHPDILSRVSVSAVGPWDVILDETANSWDEMRYVAHRYLVPLEVAEKKYGKKKYSTRVYTKYLEAVKDAGKNYGSSYMGQPNVTPQAYEKFVMVVEVYEKESNKFVVWSPDWKRDEWLYSGIKLSTGVEEETDEVYTRIPYETASGRVVLPIIPIYMSREPDAPLRGYSALRRVYDQVQEVNVIRTYQANGVRKAARQWMVAKGLLDQESMAKIAQGVDGEFIEVELSPGQDLQSLISPVPHSPVPPELENYSQIVDGDFSRGSVIAPFSRGQATNATATEVQALAAYTASEIGRMARERDGAISALAQSYLCILAVLMGDDAEVIRLGNAARTVLPEDLIGDYEYFAQDSGNTPMNDAIKKQEFSTLIPLLQQLGVPNEKILKSLVKQFDLPEDFLPEMEEAAAASSMPAAPPGGMVDPNMVDPNLADPELPDADIAGLNPGPQRIAQVLPTGGAI